MSPLHGKYNKNGGLHRFREETEMANRWPLGCLLAVRQFSFCCRLMSQVLAGSVALAGELQPFLGHSCCAICSVPQAVEQ